MRLRISALLGAGFFALIAAGCGGSEEGATAAAGEEGAMPEKLVMGIIPAEDNAEMLRAYEPVTEYMSEELGTEVEPFTATDYTGIIEAMRSGEVDVAWFGPLSYVLAAEVADAEAVAVQLDEAGGEPTYHSLMITKADSGIGGVEDLRGKTFSFVEPASTSGYLFPSKALKEAGLDPEKDLAKTTFAGGHDASALSVQNGTVDAGAVADNTLNGMIEEGVIKEDEIKVIHESEPIPESPIAVSSELSPEVKGRIQDVFVNMTEEKVGAPLGSDEAAGYAEASDADYDEVRELVDTLGLNLEELANQ